MKQEDAQERLREARAALQRNPGSVELENNVRAWERAVEQPYTLAVGDRVTDANGHEGAITDNDGTGFTVTWDRGGTEYHDHYADGDVWPFTITHLADIL
jgi:hypothetical protein